MSGLEAHKKGFEPLESFNTLNSGLHEGMTTWTSPNNQLRVLSTCRPRRRRFGRHVSNHVEGSITRRLYSKAHPKLRSENLGFRHTGQLGATRPAVAL